MLFMLKCLDQPKSFSCTAELLLLMPEIVWDHSSFRRTPFSHFHVSKTRMNRNNDRDQSYSPHALSQLTASFETIPSAAGYAL